MNDAVQKLVLAIGLCVVLGLCEARFPAQARQTLSGRARNLVLTEVRWWLPLLAMVVTSARPCCNWASALRGIEHLRRAVQLKPEYADAHFALGVALSDAGRLQDAIDHFGRAVHLRPDDRDAQERLDQALAIQQKAAELEK